MGRMSKRDEELVMAVINKSWQIVSDVLTKGGHTKQRKEEIALEVVKRTAPKNVDLTTKGESVNQVLVKFLDAEDKK